MDDFRNMFGKITQNITKTSTGVLKSVKLSVNLANEEDKLKSIYYEIGRKVHEIYAYGGTLGTFFDEKYLEITESEKRIKELKEQIENSKGTKLCPNCSRSISDSAVFCPKCGHKLTFEESKTETPAAEIKPEIKPENKQEIKIEPTPVDIEEKPENLANSDIKTCSACGHLNSSSDRFCLACGRNL